MTAAQNILRLGVALQAVGAPADRVEGAMRLLSICWRVEADFLVTPTSIMAVFAGRSTFVRVEPGAVSLGHRAVLEGVLRSAAVPCRDDAEVEASVDRCRRALDAPVALPWPDRTVLLAEVLFGMASALFFGAPLVGAAFAGALSALVWIVSRLAGRVGLGRAAPVLCAGVATALAIGASRLADVPAWPVLLGGIIGLAPGFTMTVAAAELAAGELVAGTARLASAGLRFLQLGLAIVVVASMLGAWDTGELLAQRPAGGLEWFAAVASGLACAVLLQVDARDLGRVVLGTVGGYALLVLSEHHVGGLGSPLVGAMALTVLSRTFSGERPMELILVPGILTLVPGAAGIGSLSLLLLDASGGVTAALSTLLVAVALATGVVLGEGLFRPALAWRPRGALGGALPAP